MQLELRDPRDVRDREDAGPVAQIADLPVREIVSVSHILTDLSLSPATVVRDYLADTSEAS